MGYLDDLLARLQGTAPPAGVMPLSLAGPASQQSLLQSQPMGAAALPAPSASALLPQSRPSSVAEGDESDASSPSTSPAMPKAAPLSFAGPQQPQPVQQEPVSSAPQSPGILDRLSNGVAANSMTLTGLGAGIAEGGIGRGLELAASAQRYDQANRQKGTTQNATFQALRAKGVSDADIAAAASSPEVMKALVTQHYGKHPVQSIGNGYIVQDGKVVKAYEPEDKNKLVQIGEDGLGRKTFGVMNQVTGEIKPYIPPADNTVPQANPLGNTDLKGEEYLASLPSDKASIVKQMVEGRLAPPSSLALTKPYWQGMLAAANNYDPTFDATQWSGRVAGARDFSSGKSAEMVRSANQTLHHTGQFLDSMDNLNNGSIPAFNYVGNTLNEMRGGGAPTAFRINAHAVSEEMSKVFKGANLSDAEIKQWESNLGENMSPEQQRAAVGKLRDLLHGSLDALEEKRANAIGPIAAGKQGPLIKEEGQKVLQKIDDWLAKGTGSAKPPTQAAAPISQDTVEAEMRRRGLLK